MREKPSSERVFQEKLVKELERFKWDAPDYLDGNKSRVTVDDLISNWRKELNRINVDQLEGVSLTDNEFKQALSRVNRISNSYEAAKLLAMEGSVGKIDGIYRDDNPKVTKKQITLTIFKKAEVSGGDSSYKIAREVWTLNNNRFDLILLINGLPLINIELKRTDKTLDEAFYQFKRYYRAGEYVNNFMALVQMMVVMSEIETRYFATPKTIEDFNLSFAFHWADKSNKPVNDWRKVVELFLMIPMAHQMVGDYLVIDEALNEENRKHMLLRPYQVYALQSVVGAAFGYNNDGVPRGGFVWHTTGSGKTITSFKTALFLSQRAGFDKVVFLVDRKELDQKTSDNFKAYAAYENVIVDDTKRTYELGKLLKESVKGIIITTTFKLNYLVKELEAKGDYKLQDKRMIFIIDEAHRTTMGQMMGLIKRYFKKNSLFYGFTGTPLFEENKAKGKINEKSEVINTTEKLFGPLLHEYTIDEAISDGNVLGFHVDYINTGEFISNEDLRDKLVKRFKDKGLKSDREIEKTFYSLSDVDIEKEAIKEGLLVYNDQTHIPAVVSRILANWETQSQGRFFNAILTVEYKNRVIKYYHEFKKQMKEKAINLNIVMTFSFGNELEVDNVPSDVIKEMFVDYGKFTGIEFIMGDNKRGEQNYFEDLVERSIHGGSFRNERNIDLLIVAEQLLTGYDSKYLNTLYVDRVLQLQGLIQAYSRTNRIFGRNKEFGSIVNFLYPKITESLVKDAVRLYGRGGTSTRTIVDHYEIAVDKFAIKIKKLKGILMEPSDWANIKNTEIENAFKDAYKEANNQFNLVSQYYEYKWDDKSFGLSEHDWMKYTGAYKNLLNDEEDEETLIIEQLIGTTKISGVQIIDAEYILNLIGTKIMEENNLQVLDEETLKIVYEQIQELSDMGNHEEAILLREFVDTQIMGGKDLKNERFDELFCFWKKGKQYEEILKFSEKWGLNDELLLKSFEDYSLSEPDLIPRIEELIKSVDFDKAQNQEAGSILKHNVKLVEEVPKWMKEIKRKF